MNGLLRLYGGLVRSARRRLRRGVHRVERRLSVLCFLKEVLSGLRILTTLYLAKSEHRWVAFMALKAITGTPVLLPFLSRCRVTSSVASTRGMHVFKAFFSE